MKTAGGKFAALYSIPIRCCVPVLRGLRTDSTYSQSFSSIRSNQNSLAQPDDQFPGGAKSGGGAVDIELSRDGFF